MIGSVLVVRTSMTGSVCDVCTVFYGYSASFSLLFPVGLILLFLNLFER